MNLYLVKGEERRRPDGTPYRAHVAFAASEVKARELVEEAYPRFRVAEVELLRHFAENEMGSRLLGWIAIAPVTWSC
jgi:hypothetical protein